MDPKQKHVVVVEGEPSGSINVESVVHRGSVFGTRVVPVLHQCPPIQTALNCFPDKKGY